MEYKDFFDNGKQAKKGREEVGVLADLIVILKLSEDLKEYDRSSLI